MTRDGGVATVAMLQAFVADADDAYERTAEFLAELVAAPGSVSMEWATEVAADLGTLVAGLHAALATPPAEAVDLAPRPATHDELKAWRLEAHRQLNLAIPAVTAVDPQAGAELKREASAIAARVSRFEAVATAPLVMRIHADLHLGQVLVSDDGYRVIDFEGEPIRPIEDRRGARFAAARRRLAAAVAGPRGPQRPATGRAARPAARSSGPASTSRRGSSGRGPGSWTRTRRACVVRARRSRSTSTCSTPSRSRRRPTSSCTPPPCCRRGCGLRARACAGCSSGATRRERRPADRCDALLEDVLAGPAELAATLHAQADALADIPLGVLARPTWRLIGMGSSRFAAMDAAARLRAAGPGRGGRDRLGLGRVAGRARRPGARDLGVRADAAR